MEKLDMLIEPLRALLAQVGAFLPRLALALVLLIGGWLLAKAARFTVVRALRAVNFNVLTERAGLDGFLEQGGIRTDTTGIFGALVYWLVILAALIIAFNGLGLTYITDLLHKVVLFVPHVVVALLILAFGAYFARFVATAVSTYCRNIGVGRATRAARQDRAVRDHRLRRPDRSTRWASAAPSSARASSSSSPGSSSRSRSRSASAAATGRRACSSGGGRGGGSRTSGRARTARRGRATRSRAAARSRRRSCGAPRDRAPTR
jgi:hypothetical protein